MFLFDFERSTSSETETLEVVTTKMEGRARAWRAWERVADMTFDETELVRLLGSLDKSYPWGYPDFLLMGHLLQRLREIRGVKDGSRAGERKLTLLLQGTRLGNAHTRQDYLRAGRTVACMLVQGCQIIPSKGMSETYWLREDDKLNGRRALKSWNADYLSALESAQIQFRKRAADFYTKVAPICEMVADGSLLKQPDSGKDSPKDPKQLLDNLEKVLQRTPLPVEAPAPEAPPPPSPPAEVSDTDNRKMLSRIFEQLSSGDAPESPAYTPENYGNPPGKLRYLKGMRVWVKKNAPINGGERYVTSDHCFAAVARDQQKDSGEVRCFLDGREVGVLRVHLHMHLVDLFAAAGEQADI